MTSYSGLPTDSIFTSPDKAVMFPSFSDMTTFLTSSVPYPYSDISPPASSPTPLTMTHLTPGLLPYLPSL